MNVIRLKIFILKNRYKHAKGAVEMTNRPTLEDIKKHITQKYPKQKFTIGDIYYDFFESFNISLFGIIRNAIVKLSKMGFVEYKIVERGTPRSSSENKTKGAIYWIK